MLELLHQHKNNASFVKFLCFGDVLQFGEAPTTVHRRHRWWGQRCLQESCGFTLISIEDGCKEGMCQPRPEAFAESSEKQKAGLERKGTDGGSIGGSKGRLTDSAMNRLQNYFGIAIRENKGNLADMKKAAEYDCTSSADHPRHENFRKLVWLCEGQRQLHT